MPDQHVRLETRDISKSYGSNRVLFNVDSRLDRGQSVAVIGENGAGKSTFAKILTGVIRPDAGTIALDGRVVSFASPRDALHQGIAFIPQELAYVPHLTVAENILLGRWPSWRGLTTLGAAIKQARANADHLFPTASVIKVSILAELFAQAEEGRVRLDERLEMQPSDIVGGSGVLKELLPGLQPTLTDLAMLMVVLSDNTATNMLIDRLGGCDAINQRVQGEYGLTSVALHIAWISRR